MALQYITKPFVVKAGDACLNQIFPPECVRCQQEGAWICTTCLEESTQIKTQTCPFCNRVSGAGKTCQRCQKEHKLTGSQAIWYYSDAIRDLVHAFKYQGITASAAWLIPLLQDRFASLPLKRDTILFTSVPTTPEKQTQRGYNQSALLAQGLAQAIGLPYAELLLRLPQAPSQTRLTRSERFANALSQFSLRKRLPDLSGKTVVIVDDVITTGATLSSCATLLKQAGAKAVWGLTIAKD